GGCGAVVGLARVAATGLRHALGLGTGGRAGLDPLLDLFLDPRAFVLPDHSADRKTVTLDPAFLHGPIVDDPALAQVFKSHQANHGGAPVVENRAPIYTNFRGRWSYLSQGVESRTVRISAKSEGRRPSPRGRHPAAILVPDLLDGLVPGA